MAGVNFEFFRQPCDSVLSQVTYYGSLKLSVNGALPQIRNAFKMAKSWLRQSFGYELETIRAAVRTIGRLPKN